MAFPDTDLTPVVTVYLGADLSADPGTWTPTDWSSRLVRKPVQTKTGRSDGQETLQAGSCILWLENTDGALTPLLATSTYYPDWDFGVPMQFAVDDVGASPPYAQFSGYVTDIRPVIVPGSGGNISTVQVTVAGTWQILTQGRVEKSALRRTIPTESPLAYWPMEDGPDSLELASGLPGGTPLTVTTADADRIGVSGLAPGAGTCLDVGKPGTLGTTSAGAAHTSLFTLSATSAASWSVSWVARCYIPASITTTPLFRLDGPVSVLIYVIDQRMAAMVAGSLGNLVYTGTIAVDPGSLVDPHHFVLTLVQNGTGIDIQLFCDGVVATGGGLDGQATLASTTNALPTGFQFGSGTTSGITSDTSLLLGQVAIHTGAYATNLNALPGPVSAYTGEMAHVRAERICSEEGITFTTTATTSIEMGPQPVADETDVLRDCELVDRGILYELLHTWGLGYLAASQRVNQSSSLAIDLSTYRTTSGTQADVLAPIRNNKRMRNDWTVTRPQGSSATAKDDDHIARRGRHKGSRDSNVARDNQLPDQAQWLVHEGTFEGLRYPPIPLDLGSNATLLPDWLELTAGATIERTHGTIGQHPTDPYRGVIEGYSQEIGHRTWSATINAPPADTWTVFELSATTADAGEFVGRLAADDDAAIRAAITTTATSILVDPNRTRFTTVADDFDPDLTVRFGGETADVSSIATTAGTFVAAGTVAHASNASVTPSLPAGVQTGDLLLVFAAIRNSGTGLPSAPTGYTRLPVFNAADNAQLFAKVHSGSESAPTVTFTGGVANADTSAQMAAFRGTPVTLTDLADVVVLAATQLNSSAADIATPALASLHQQGCIILALGWKQDDWTSVAVVSGFTEIGEPDTTTGDDQGIVWDYVIQTTPADIPASSFVVTGGASAISRSAVVALAAGYQTFTVAARSTNGVVKAHAAGTRIEVEDAFVLGL